MRLLRRAPASHLLPWKQYVAVLGWKAASTFSVVDSCPSSTVFGFWCRKVASQEKKCIKPRPLNWSYPCLPRPVLVLDHAFCLSTRRPFVWFTDSHFAVISPFCRAIVDQHVTLRFRLRNDRVTVVPPDSKSHQEEESWRGTVSGMTNQATSLFPFH